MRYNLRAVSETALDDALRAAGLVNDGAPAEGVALDVIGTIYRPTGEADVEGAPVLVAIDGWHANLIADLTPAQEALLPIIPAPTNPYRIFAGEQ